MINLFNSSGLRIDLTLIGNLFYSSHVRKLKEFIKSKMHIRKHGNSLVDLLGLDLQYKQTNIL